MYNVVPCPSPQAYYIHQHSIVLRLEIFLVSVIKQAFHKKNMKNDIFINFFFHTSPMIQ